jgi:hypothetical protein
VNKVVFRKKLPLVVTGGTVTFAVIYSFSLELREYAE